MGSRRIVGFAIGEHHDADLAQAALQMAVAVRGGKDALTEVLMHTDQGSEYTARNFRAACGRVAITQSMGRAGSALDNAVIESWHSTVEFELRQLEHFTTKAQARRRVATWIEEYNHDRRHSSLAMMSPIAYELQLAQQRRRSRGRSMSAPLPRVQHGAVLAGVKATPSGWPPASPDPSSGRRPPAATGSGIPTKSKSLRFRGLPPVREPAGERKLDIYWLLIGLVSGHCPDLPFGCARRRGALGGIPTNHPNQ